MFCALICFAVLLGVRCPRSPKIAAMHWRLFYAATRKMLVAVGRNDGRPGGGFGVREGRPFLLPLIFDAFSPVKWLDLHPQRNSNWVAVASMRQAR